VFAGETVPHYTQINGLMSTFASQGLQALGFPCNQFGNQEPGANSEILNGLRYVRPGNGFVPAFQLTQLVSVNGCVDVLQLVLGSVMYDTPCAILQCVHRCCLAMDPVCVPRPQLRPRR
jgi:hypothetical protein